MSRPSRKNPEETRERLLDAAEIVFNEKGVSKTTLNDIAQAAGVTRGAIYWHFGSKSDLFNAMVNRVRIPLRESVEALAVESHPDPIAGLQETYVALMEQVLDDTHYRHVMQILFHKCELTADADQLLEYYQEWMMRGKYTLMRVLENARKNGHLPEDLDVEFTAVTLHVIFNGLLNTWLLVPHSFDLVKDSNRIYRHIFEILRNGRGFRLQPPDESDTQAW